MPSFCSFGPSWELAKPKELCYVGPRNGPSGPIFICTESFSKKGNRLQSQWLEKVRSLAEEICQRESCILYDLDFSGMGKGRTLRVFIDKDSGAGIEDCSNVSKGLNLLLDVQDVIPGGPYHLEVSTPGIDRNLRLHWHFAKAVGKKIWIRINTPFEALGVELPRIRKSKQLESELVEMVDEQLHFKVDGVSVLVPMQNIEKAKIVFEVKQGHRK